MKILTLIGCFLSILATISTGIAALLTEDAAWAVATLGWFVATGRTIQLMTER